MNVKYWSSYRSDSHFAFVHSTRHSEDAFEEGIKNGYQQNKPDYYGNILIHYLICDLSRFKIAVNYGADILVKDCNGNYFFHVMIQQIYDLWIPENIENDIYDFIDICVKSGLSIIKRNKYNQNAIQYAKYMLYRRRKTACYCLPQYMQKCGRCRQLSRFNTILICLEDQDKKQKTLFQYLLPKVKLHLYKNTNKRSRKE